jgi:transcriptional regulator with XRE-family HTH domain
MATIGASEWTMSARVGGGSDNRPMIGRRHRRGMPTRDEPAGRARRRAMRQLRDLVADIRASRISLGLSQQEVARAAGVSRDLIGRLEREELERLPFGDLAAIASTLGLDLRIGAWPAGDPLRDQVQLRLLEAFRLRLHASLTWRTEVPLPISGDRRAWDAVVGTPDGLVGIEGLSRIGAVDATIRRANLKLGDDPRISRAVLVVNDTARNRSALRAGIATVRAEYPLQTREVMAALSAGETPRLNGVVVLRLPSRERRPQAVHIGGNVVDARGAARPKFVDKPVGGAAPGP